VLKTEGMLILPHLFVGRVFRIVPLYLFLVVVVLLNVGIRTQWHIEEPQLNLEKHVGEPMTPANVSLAFLRACRSVNVSDFRFHDLRHTAASWMRMHGADIHTVALILGHKDLRMAARYQHLSPAFLSDAVKLLDVAFTASGDESEGAESESSSCSIVTTALPGKIIKRAKLA
jgi:integrase